MSKEIDEALTQLEGTVLAIQEEAQALLHEHSAAVSTRLGEVEDVMGRVAELAREITNATREQITEMDAAIHRSSEEMERFRRLSEERGQLAVSSLTGEWQQWKQRFEMEQNRRMDLMLQHVQKLDERVRSTVEGQNERFKELIKLAMLDSERKASEMAQKAQRVVYIAGAFGALLFVMALLALLW